MALNLKHQTIAQLAARIREKYRSANKERLAKIARLILNGILADDFTDLQVRNAFGLTAGQWTTLKSKMQTLVANQDAVNIAAGE